ncbi:DUF6961 family protein [Aurantiacibacter suaedae]|uniref:DUF6961 family protein n=1 Tax=Aurantiacibacter suaedae TaxID=2545755 RepID=UPI0010FA0919|nr:hypothetical protein [Aurantiacibacter suaedae]
MAVTQEQELWALALWVEKHHGDDGQAYIEGRIEHFTDTNEGGAVRMWEEVASRFAGLERAPRSETN